MHEKGRGGGLRLKGRGGNQGSSRAVAGAVKAVVGGGRGGYWRLEVQLGRVLGLGMPLG